MGADAAEVAREQTDHDTVNQAAMMFLNWKTITQQIGKSMESLEDTVDNLYSGNKRIPVFPFFFINTIFYLFLSMQCAWMSGMCACVNIGISMFSRRYCLDHLGLEFQTGVS